MQQGTISESVVDVMFVEDVFEAAEESQASGKAQNGAGGARLLRDLRR